MQIYSITNFSIFDLDADTLVNPVNLMGVMGKGLALQFKEKFPENFVMYKEWCVDSPEIGSIFIWRENNKYIINFPTKIHWKDPSKLEYIKESTETMSDWIINVDKNFEVKIIAIPKVGCGLGGLDWNIVKPKIIEILNRYLKDTDIEVLFVE